MKLAIACIDDRSTSIAILDNGKALDIARAASDLAGDVGDVLTSGSLHAIIAGGQAAHRAVADLIGRADAGELADCQHPMDAVSLEAPYTSQNKNVFCVGRNYVEHIAEGEKALNQKIGVTEHPVFFTKPPTSIVPPMGDVLVFPEVSEAIDYEVELAIVIGKAGRNIAKADAFDHVFGYTILNDITARDIQRRHGGQYFKGKGLDGSCPIGPWIVTTDAIGDPQNLSIGTTVNGEQLQDGNTSDMIFDIPTLIASLSEGMTLEPGDIIATGTPSGVGYAMDPPKYLKAGDTVVCQISGIGALTNTVRAV